MITVEHGGCYPTQCLEPAIVTVEGLVYEVFINSGWTVETGPGPWTVEEWEGVPEEHQAAALDEINRVVPHGCCGGCV